MTKWLQDACKEVRHAGLAVDSCVAEFARTGDVEDLAIAERYHALLGEQLASIRALADAQGGEATCKSA